MQDTIERAMKWSMALVLCSNLFLIGCNGTSRLRFYPAEDAIEVSADAKSPQSFEGLQQVVAFQDRIFSGAKPTGEAGFESLMKMQVRTILCVDGVSPDVDTARNYGMRTIHIPLKYEAPTSEQIFDLTTVVARGFKRGNVYIHCHQGKHRSAATAAIVSIALGSLTINEAKERMHVSETSYEYKGLWEVVEQSTAINMFDLLRNNKVYPAVVEPIGMTEQMIALDEAMDNLILIRRASWNAPTHHPDLVGVAEAGILADTFRKIQLSQEANAYPSDFEVKIVNALHQASSLEVALLQNLPEHELNTYMQRVKQSCIDCHSVFRK